MSEKEWWSNYGPFQRWKACPTRPDPAEVLRFYLGKCGISPEERIDYLKDTLDIQKTTAYHLLKGEGFDSISRTRLLVQDLKIPPPLLGLDAKYYPIAHYAYWWQASNYPFHADRLGYPVTSEVIAYLRMQRTHREEGGRIKAWSQEDLAEATVT